MSPKVLQKFERGRVAALVYETVADDSVSRSIMVTRPDTDNSTSYQYYDTLDLLWVVQQAKHWMFDQAHRNPAQIEFVDTVGLFDAMVWDCADRKRPVIQHKALRGKALEWWKNFERENYNRPKFILRVFEELEARELTAYDLYLSYSQSGTDSFTANLDYLDYRRFAEQSVDILPRESVADPLGISVGDDDSNFDSETAESEIRASMSFADASIQAQQWWQTIEERCAANLRALAFLVDEFAHRTIHLEELFVASLLGGTENLEALVFFVTYLRAVRSDPHASTLSPRAQQKWQLLLEGLMYERLGRSELSGLRQADRDTFEPDPILLKRHIEFFEKLIASVPSKQNGSDSVRLSKAVRTELSAWLEALSFHRGTKCRALQKVVGDLIGHELMSVGSSLGGFGLATFVQDIMVLLKFTMHPKDLLVRMAFQLHERNLNKRTRSAWARVYREALRAIESVDESYKNVAQRK